ncbi:MAG TPA: SDR family oxidoreductase [Geminicoccus sp.]|jgi:3-oxoacyl-[acyl-carrier protein] reductase|uniref:SDR family oxidoreductase n=1 Tax=Geminicoccus sp. TaxID=2024832 RepID=UPI002E3723F3|nr:SDR family oxidoreductase [Geminicoccus sp.]HEX2525479.1 SDR family oxidoreductase [Geminicoccus sp.]
MSALQGKVALVTGGSRGIGAAIVRRLVQDGAAVAFTYVSSREKAEALAREMEAEGGKLLPIQADATDADAVTSAVRQAVQAFGKLDVLVNSAGVYEAGSLDELSIEAFDRMVAVNIRSVFVAIQEAVRHMPEGGRIVTIGSCVSERTPAAGMGPYAMSKAAITGLTRGLARDLGPRGITVNNVQPGPVDTDMNPADGPAAEIQHGWMALPRHGQPSEIAAMVAYLAGPEAGYVTGASLLIDGGFAA